MAKDLRNSKMSSLEPSTNHPASNGPRPMSKRTGFDPNHERVDLRVFNLSRIKPLASCLREHVTSAPDVIITSITSGRKQFPNRVEDLKSKKTCGKKSLKRKT
ncbi:hypothetical protein EVAR_36433_1 [Eumeta japonica]|uniref:Uncharacterized protein n=1 Tax=Eumeta variegata TaxID=151549 RepID=A0A4C1VQR7_EUMVA|nr:hypothetical protein EVAR_36433_1 [Eumeta japonica]